MNERISDLAQQHHRYTPRTTPPPATRTSSSPVTTNALYEHTGVHSLGHIACNPPIWHALALGGATVCPIWATITSARLPIALGTACTTVQCSGMEQKISTEKTVFLGNEINKLPPRTFRFPNRNSYYYLCRFLYLFTQYPHRPTRLDTLWRSPHILSIDQRMPNKERVLELDPVMRNETRRDQFNFNLLGN